MPRMCLEFEPGEAGAEAAKLEKFSDAGGSQIQRLTDAGRFTLFEREQYNYRRKPPASAREKTRIHILNHFFLLLPVFHTFSKSSAKRRRSSPRIGVMTIKTPSLIKENFSSWVMFYPFSHLEVLQYYSPVDNA